MTSAILRRFVTLFLVALSAVLGFGFVITLWLGDWPERFQQDLSLAFLFGMAASFVYGMGATGAGARIRSVRYARERIERSWFGPMVGVVFGVSCLALAELLTISALGLPVIGLVIVGLAVVLLLDRVTTGAQDQDPLNRERP